MNKIKAAVLFLTTMLVANFINAQSIDEGKKFLYYEKYKSAKAVFEKLVAANANNADAVYWLGQTMLGPDKTENIAAVKELYRKTLEANSNNALLTAGIGHIELLEGKTQDARNRFETAISLSQGKNIAVLNAIGLANGDFDSKNGDANYAVDKLKLATTLKGFKDPETWALLGDAYRKASDGGSAQRAYESALTVNPTYARAKYRIGKIYQTQGFTQSEIYMRYFNEAIAMDANYAPVFNNLYNLFYKTDVKKSAEYLEKYLTLMGDDEPQSCYYRATIKYAQGLFAESITQADACITGGGANPDVRLYGLKGYAYDKLNDSVNAKTSFEKFFQLQKPEKVGPTDIEFYVRNLLKFPGNEAAAATLIEKGITFDTTEIGKVALMKTMAVRFETQKQYLDAANWYKKILDTKKAPTKTDIFNASINYSRGGNYQAAIDGWSSYITKYPNETYGYYMTALSQEKMDTTMALGLAAPSYQKVIDLGEAQWATDSAKVKTHLLNAYKYFIQYTYNVKKDKKGASDYCARYLLKEPTDGEVLALKKQFDAPARTTPARTAPAAKPATGGKTPAKTPAIKAAPPKKK
ncbi:tetratricopeptide repeat protein [Ferruginibacter sp.]